jgi:hypothetical protein
VWGLFCIVFKGSEVLKRGLGGVRRGMHGGVRYFGSGWRGSEVLRGNCN